MSTTDNIKLLPAQHSDLLPIATLEKDVFWHEEFSALAFGPHRGSEAHLARRVEQFGEAPKPGHSHTIFKAVLTSHDEEGKEVEEIVGAAIWRVVRVSEEEKGNEGEGGEKEKEDWGEGSNVKFCEDVLVTGDEFMMRSCEGKDYAKLFVLIVSPSFQRRGIGSLLLSAFLAEADSLNIQAVLGASKYGRGLYKRFGFVDYEIMKLKLWEYEGGERMGEDEHVVMHRPAKGK